jgi:hypothetical protein
MTRNRQNLTQEQKAIVKNEYLAGQKPAAIAAKTGVKVATVRQMVWRQGLTADRVEIKTAAARTAGEVLEDARKRHAEKLAGIMDKQIESLEIDAEKLRDGWPLAQDAAGASSLMRAKALHQDRTLRHFGVGPQEREAPSTFNLALLMTGSSKPEPVNVTPTDPLPPEGPTTIDPSTS